MSSRTNEHYDSAGVDFHYLGMIDFDLCLALQRRLVYEASGRDDERITVLLCQHTSMITVGRAGSRQHIRLTQDELDSLRWQVRWVSRGGGCVLHGPGQLAIYPIVPLRARNWTVGEYLERLQQALVTSAVSLGVPAYTRPGRYGVWGKSGLLAAVGAAVQNWITSHGAFLNIHASGDSQSFVEANPAELAAPGDSPIMGSLLSETDRPARIETVARIAARRLADSFDCVDRRWYEGHPLLFEISEHQRERLARVG
ncbi:lipoyl(octanoyl) transferase LipB [Blastopirellula marina]|nr:hypothetical protein [Blastopirellula marina]